MSTEPSGNVPPAGAPRRHYVVLIVGITLVLAYTVGVVVTGLKPRLAPPPLASSLGSRVDMIVSYQEAFLDVVLWGMGLVGTVAVLLVGYSWFTTRETYERDLQALKDQIAAATTKQADELRTVTQALQTEINAATLKQTEDLRSARQALAEQLDDARHSSRIAIEEQRSALATARTEIAADLLAGKAVVKDVITLTENLTHVAQALGATRCEIWLEDARRYEGNVAILALIQVLSTAAVLPDSPVDWVDSALARAAKSLQNPTAIDAEFLTRLEQSIATAARPQHKQRAEAVINAIRARPELKDPGPVATPQ